jgi:Outer membrane protein beta-barrel domain
MRSVTKGILLALLVTLAPVAVPAFAKGGGAVTGFAAGAFIPEGDLAEFNSTSYYISSRSIFAEKYFGGRASAYYGDSTGKDGAAGGRVYGFDVAALLKFGSPETFFYVYAGAGYGSLTFTMPGNLPGNSYRTSGHDWCYTGGVGISIKRRVYIEASYVSYQTDPRATDYIPVVIGFEF